MKYFFAWVGDISLHGIRHGFVSDGKRKFAWQIIWRLLFCAFFVTCVALQSSLLYEIVYKKPTDVSVQYTRKESINFPNVVLCDMNPDLQPAVELSERTFGSQSVLLLMNHQIHLAFATLYFAARNEAIRNLTEFIQKYPIMARQYETYYNQTTPLVRALFC